MSDTRFSKSKKNDLISDIADISNVDNFDTPDQWVY